MFGPIRGEFYLCKMKGTTSKVRVRTEGKDAGFCEFPGRHTKQVISSSGADQWFFFKDPSSLNKDKVKKLSLTH